MHPEGGSWTTVRTHTPSKLSKVQRTFVSHPLGALQVSGERITAPSEPDGILVASSGSPVPLSLRPWPIGMHIIMACSAEWDTLAFACYHDVHPERFLPTALLVQVCEFAYMVHFYTLFASAYLACVVS